MFIGLSTAITNALGTPAFNPSTLFASFTGYIYDLNDLTTVFQDSAGTTAGAVNQPVGLVLDKSKGLALGAELVTNGDFSNGTTGWTANFLSASVVGGRVELTRTGTGQSFYTSISTVAGKWYEINFEYQNGSTSGGIYIGTAVGFADVLATTSLSSPTEKLQKILFLATSATSVVHFYLLANGTYYLDDVSVKELPGNHRYQTTAASRPILRGTPTGLNLFASYGTPGSGWADSGSGVATATASTASIPTNVVPSNGRVYRVRYTATVTSGTVRLTLGGQNGVTRSASGTYEEYIAATSTAALSFQGVSAFTGTVSAIDVRDVSADSVTTPHALQHDGADDFHQTAPVNFTATDKMTVCHGVRKLSDRIDQATIVELGTNSAAAAGFALQASPTFSARYRAQLFGTSRAVRDTTPIFPATETAVITLALDIAGATVVEEIVGRRNGSSVFLENTLSPAGTGNLPNAALYFGRRAGTYLPYNGLEFSSICVGKAVTAAELANIERWVAQRTGVVI